MHTTDFDKVLREEEAYIRQRRRRVHINEGEAAEGKWGIAFSNGGARASTLMLGVMRKLMSEGTDFFRRIDYLSAVGGSSFMAASFASLLTGEKSAHKRGIFGTPQKLSFSARNQRSRRRERRQARHPNGAFSQAHQRYSAAVLETNRKYTGLIRHWCYGYDVCFFGIDFYDDWLYVAASFVLLLDFAVCGWRVVPTIHRRKKNKHYPRFENSQQSE